MRTLIVDLGTRSYSIHVGANLLARGELWSNVPGSKVAVVTNTVVAPLYLECLTDTLKATGRRVSSLVLPDGESEKNLQSLNRIFDFLLNGHFDRSSVLVALGGGVIGDLAGFAAASYQRGIAFVQVPTTLLSQVDSSVGGKTGVNHPLGKNMIGAFWQPHMVLADTDTLNTLPDRELSAGLAEVIKYGLIGDLPFLEWLETNMDALRRREPEALSHAIERSCADKAAVVASDERETAREGGRALLNLGHTFGHAIETGAGYGVWLHGEAVAMGTVMAAELSRRLGWLTVADCQRVKDVLARAGLPVVAPRLGVERYLELMAHDKKVMDGRLRLVLLRLPGEAVTYADAPLDDIRAAIDACCG